MEVKFWRQCVGEVGLYRGDFGVDLWRWIAFNLATLQCSNYGNTSPLIIYKLLDLLLQTVALRHHSLLIIGAFCLPSLLNVPANERVTRTLFRMDIVPCECNIAGI